MSKAKSEGNKRKFFKLFNSILSLREVVNEVTNLPVISSSNSFRLIQIKFIVIIEESYRTTISKAIKTASPVRVLAIATEVLASTQAIALTAG